MISNQVYLLRGGARGVARGPGALRQSQKVEETWLVNIEHLAWEKLTEFEAEINHYHYK